MFNYKLGFIPTSLVIIGAGGTGSRLVPLITQFMKTIGWVQNLKIYLVDNDIVEEKNLLRQNFIRLDIGKPKAVVLAERYSKAFDINIIPVVKRVSAPNGTVTILSETTHADLGVVTTNLQSLSNSIIIMCVDSAKARVDIINAVNQSSGKLLIIDAGNENDFGQVLLFSNECATTRWSKQNVDDTKLPGIGIPFNFDIPTIPMPFHFYEGMKDVSEKSCAELDQTLAINAMMATSIMGIVQNLIYQKPISFHKLNVSLAYGTIPEIITIDYLYERAMDANVIRNKLSTPPYYMEVDKIFKAVQSKMVNEFPDEILKNMDKAKAKAKPTKKKLEKELDI